MPKQKQEQKQEQKVVINIDSKKRKQKRRAPRGVSTKQIKPQQVQTQSIPSIPTYLGLQTANNAQLLNSLNNTINTIFKAQQKPEFTRTISTEPIVSPQVVSKVTEAIVEKSIPSAAKKEASLYTDKGKLDKRSKAFRDLPLEERDKLVLEETMNKPKRARKVKETLDTGGEADMEGERITKIIKSQKLHDTTRMVAEPIPKPFKGVSALNLSTEEEED